MFAARTLIDLLHQNRESGNAITYLEGEHDARRVDFDELIKRASALLHELQARGAVRGDKFILFVASNEQFIQGFWAAVLGGIIPVPVAIGISDEHRHKLLRIVRKLGNPYFYTDTKTLDRLGTFAQA